MSLGTAPPRPESVAGLRPRRPGRRAAAAPRRSLRAPLQGRCAVAARTRCRPPPRRRAGAGAIRTRSADHTNRPRRPPRRNAAIDRRPPEHRAGDAQLQVGPRWSGRDRCPAARPPAGRSSALGQSPPGHAARRTLAWPSEEPGSRPRLLRLSGPTRPMSRPAAAEWGTSHRAARNSERGVRSCLGRSAFRIPHSALQSPRSAGRVCGAPPSARHPPILVPKLQLGNEEGRHVWRERRK